MLLRIFKSSQPLSWVLIILLLIVLRTGAFSYFFFIETDLFNTSSPIVFLDYINANHPIISFITATLLVLFTSFQLNGIAQSSNLLVGIHYLAVLISGVLLSFGFANYQLNPYLLSLPFQLLSLKWILTPAKNALPLSVIFNAAFFIGISGIIYPPSMVLSLLFYFSLMYLNPATWRHYVIGGIGIGTPFLFFHSLKFVFSTIIPEQINHAALSSPHSFHWFSTSNLVVLGLLIVGIPMYFHVIQSQVIRTRKLLTINLIFILLGVLSLLFGEKSLAISSSMVIIPLSVYFSVVQLDTKKWWWSDTTFLLLLFALFYSYLE